VVYPAKYATAPELQQLQPKHILENNLCRFGKVIIARLFCIKKYTDEK